MGSGSCEILNLLAYPVSASRPECGFVGACVRDLSARDRGVRRRGQGPCRCAMDFVFDLDAIAAAIDDNTRIVFLGNPNNPTGTIYRTRRMAAIPCNGSRARRDRRRRGLLRVRARSRVSRLDAGSRRHAPDAHHAAHLFEDFRPGGAARRLLGGARPTSSRCSTTSASHSTSPRSRRSRWRPGWTTSITCGARCGSTRGDGVPRGRVRAPQDCRTCRARRISSWPRSARGAAFSKSCCNRASSCARCTATAFRATSASVSGFRKRTVGWWRRSNACCGASFALVAIFRKLTIFDALETSVAVAMW